ncbi:MAG: hypothetical protein IJ736_04285, partial [Firmicutes bacterium]|nr:hypothetical protein [Bacillota bacterium]
TGYSGDGQVVMHYTNTEYADRVIEDFQNGIMTEHTIVATMTNQNTNKTASYSIQDAVFTEITPIDFSTGVAKHTLPFRCTTIKPISRVSA